MVKSIKGVEVNMEALMLQNQYTVALGNAGMNARGDLIGKNGKILKTREQLAAEYNTKVENAAVEMPITQESVTQPKPATKAEAKVDTKPATKEKE